MRCINFAELKNADLIKTRTTVQPYTSRHAYTSYFQRLGQSAPTTDRPGSSRQPTETDEHERMLTTRLSFNGDTNTTQAQITVPGPPAPLAPPPPPLCLKINSELESHPCFPPQRFATGSSRGPLLGPYILHKIGCTTLNPFGMTLSANG
ncbi:transducin/WD40 repeat-like superfamily protein [Striga asiatica]|uniref:Transducin/WD40 repeat-like superfamily protein n=1 Tax=Striga asiatica TaxID=4170 RepID=A0A5A7R4V8_STRAF|nr:transducin/WD40 repeat-like superfamily protein [Striga asiatica]